MQSSAFTIKAFGIYVLLTGVALLIAPNLTLTPLGFAPTSEIWIRVVGAMASILGYYYIVCGVADAKVFFKATIPGRLAFFVLCVALVVFAGAPLPLILFGIVDILGAAWTFIALRREERT